MRKNSVGNDVVLNIRMKAKNAKKELKSLQKAGADLAKVLGVLAGAGTFAVARFAKFENQMLGVKTLLDKNSFGAKGLEKGFKQLQDQALDTFSSIPVEIDSVTKSLFDTVSAGIDAGESIKFVRTASKLAVAGITDLSIATDGLTSAINAYGMEADSADKVAAKFFAAQKAGKTTVEELSSGFGLVANMAANMGVSLDELLASVAAATKGGVRTKQAYTSLAAILANVSKPTKEAAKEAKKLGVSFDQTSLRSKGLARFLGDIVNNGKFTKESVTELFGSVEALKVAMSITGNQAEDFRDILKTLSDEQSNLNTFTEAYETQLQSISNQWKIFTNGLDAATISLGEEFSPEVRYVITELNNLLNAMKNNSNFIRSTLVGTFFAIAEGFSQIGKAIGEVAFGILDIPKKLGDAFGNIAFDIVEALKGVNTSDIIFGDFTSIDAAIDKIKKSASKSFKGVTTDIFSESQGKAEKILSGLGKKIQEAFNVGAKFVQDKSNEIILETNKKTKKEGKKTVKDIDDYKNKLKQSGLSIASQALQATQSGPSISGQLEAVERRKLLGRRATQGELLDPSLTQALRATTPGPGGSSFDFGALGQAIIDGGLTGALTSTLTQSFGFSGAGVSVGAGLASDAISFFGQDPEAFASQLANLFGTETVKNIAKNIDVLVDALPELIDAFVEAMPDLIDAIIESLPELIDGLVDAIPEILPPLIEGLIRAIPVIAVQLTLSIIENLPEIVGALVKGIAEGLKKAVGDIFSVSTIGDFFGSVGSFLGSAAGGLKEAVVDIVSVGGSFLGYANGGFVTAANGLQRGLDSRLVLARPGEVILNPNSSAQRNDGLLRDSGMINNKPIIINLDGEVLARSTTKYQTQFGASGI